MSTNTISPRELHDLSQQREIDLLDVRTPVEFQEVHATLARNVPLDALDPRAEMATGNGEAVRPLYVICRTGGRASKACERLTAAGHPNVVNVEGGTLAWEAAGLPVQRGRKVMSLERQVRIAAGLLVLLGALLAVTVHIAFVGLSAFVGAGLVFAGLTDTCGMGLMLARMPWNRVRNAPDDSATASCRTNA